MIVDDATTPGGRAALRTTVSLLVGATLAGASFSAAGGYLFDVASAGFAVRVRERLFAAVTSNEQAWFDGVKVGDVSSRLSSDTATLTSQLGIAFNMSLQSVTMGAGAGVPWM